MTNSLKQFIRDEEGATAVEYALIVALIAVAIILSLQGVRDALIDVFEKIATTLSDASG
ncbi:MAG: Flp family type IVb pilin [Gallionellaceae bacterium]|nr:Flp family type IVb pilin [Gallionellaceae bacterium]